MARVRGMVHCTDAHTMLEQMKRAQQQLEFLEIQEGYIKDEMKNLKREMIRAKEVRLLVRTVASSARSDSMPR